jgi:hypothetical protein
MNAMDDEVRCDVMVTHTNNKKKRNKLDDEVGM